MELIFLHHNARSVTSADAKHVTLNSSGSISHYERAHGLQIFALED